MGMTEISDVIELNKRTEFSWGENNPPSNRVCRSETLSNNYGANSNMII